MTESGRTPHSSERAEGDPPGDDTVDRRTPRPEQPAEGEDTDEDTGEDTVEGADTPDV
jgi:hypothetical protein